MGQFSIIKYHNLLDTYKTYSGTKSLINTIDVGLPKLRDEEDILIMELLREDAKIKLHKIKNS